VPAAPAAAPPRNARLDTFLAPLGFAPLGLPLIAPSSLIEIPGFYRVHVTVQNFPVSAPLGRGVVVLDNSSVLPLKIPPEPGVERLRESLSN